MAGAKIKKVRKSIQNKELTQEEALDYFSRMAVYDEAISEREKQVKNLKRELKKFENVKGVANGIKGSLREIYSANEKARQSRFDVWVQLIVRLRNQYTVGGGYTKRSFRQEVQTYLK